MGSKLIDLCAVVVPISKLTLPKMAGDKVDNYLKQLSKDSCRRWSGLTWLFNRAKMFVQDSLRQLSMTV